MLPSSSVFSWILRIAALPVVLVVGFCPFARSAEPSEINYDEGKVPNFALPYVLEDSNGQAITNADGWQARRKELLAIFEKEMFGATPTPPKESKFTVLSEKDIFAGKAIFRTVKVEFLAPGNPEPFAFEFSIVLPRREKPVGLFIGLNVFDRKQEPFNPGKPLQTLIASRASQLPPLGRDDLPGMKLGEFIVDRGYGYASFEPEGIAPDDAKRFASGVIAKYRASPEQERSPTEWGAIGAWAFGISRIADYAKVEPRIDSKRLAVIGHSRMGKTALWAGAQDERFSIVISNNSGCGGAALSRRQFGETVKLINNRFPHWFCVNFRKYNGMEDKLPIDQHHLIALSAPRAVYVASAADDRWADPRGEFLAAREASPAWNLFGLAGYTLPEPPKINQSGGDRVGYHLRVGPHAMTDFDWLAYLDFADRIWKPLAK